MDARIRYTKEAIKKAFMDLSAQMPIQKIRVTEICRQAQINRATFYKYYDNPFDLLEKLEGNLLDELEEKLVAGEAMKKEEWTLADIFRTVLYHMKENATAYDLLFSENGDRKFKSRLFHLCFDFNMKMVRVYFPQLEETKQKWIFYFLAEGCSAISVQWRKEHMNTDVEEIVGFLEEMVRCVNENGFLQKADLQYGP